MEFQKIFNTNRTLFFESDDKGSVGLRGKFIHEYLPENYNKITGIGISGFKKKNLNVIFTY